MKHMYAGAWFFCLLGGTGRSIRTASKYKFIGNEEIKIVSKLTT
ncbi:hypothetical protein HanPSC8_Chr10g0412091 [Helianthus annuus]|nr:hypothetical protein HanPSC8_Chr10g0412091 [Helianthus annuus]